MKSRRRTASIICAGVIAPSFRTARRLTREQIDGFGVSRGSHVKNREPGVRTATGPAAPARLRFARPPASGAGLGLGKRKILHEMTNLPGGTFV
jgi:hypothetical protein